MQVHLFHLFHILQYIGTVALELQHTRIDTSQVTENNATDNTTTANNTTDSNSSIKKEPVSRKLTLDLPNKLNLQSLQQKRPSIAPVPALLEANDIRIQLNSDIESESDDDIAFADNGDPLDASQGHPE